MKKICVSLTACLYSMIVAALMLILTSCDTVLEYPEGGGYNPEHPHGKVILSIKTDLNYDFLGEYNYDFNNPFDLQLTTRGNSHWMVAEAPHQIRYLLKAYNIEDKSVSPEAQETFTFTSPIESSFQETLNMELLPGSYRLVMWADYVDLGGAEDKYYNTSDFSEIILNGEDGHYGSNAYRDAFYGETTVTVVGAMEADVYAEIELKRPVAMYTFVSTDLDEFLESEISRTVGESGNGSRSPHDATGSSQQAPPLNNYKVRIVYTKYMPSSFNAHTGKPVDSRLGVEYDSRITLDEQGRAKLAFDHVFTNGVDTSVAVAMEVIHSDGTIVARMPQFDVPLKRSHHTIVTGKFLTTKSGGEIGIQPDFDGEFNIFIQ
ncbi:MAG: hypothetical protein K2M87_05685 [Muribaculaceae bacterium]|nr:hypothetical protein [Muribaculaceae bacterium]